MNSDAWPKVAPMMTDRMISSNAIPRQGEPGNSSKVMMLAAIAANSDTLDTGARLNVFEALAVQEGG